MEYIIFLKMNPPTVTAQESKIAVVNNKPRVYKTERQKSAKAEILWKLNQYRTQEMLNCPIELSVTWYFLAGKGHKHNEWRSTRPDTDNLEKLLKDCITEAGYWRDDALVVREIAEKIWVKNNPGILIKIKELPKIKEEI